MFWLWNYWIYCESLQDLVNDIHAQVDKVTEICNTINNSVEKFKEIELQIYELAKLTPKIEQLDKRIQKVESICYENVVINEMNERQRRSKNVIIFKLKESNVENDLAFLLDLFKDAPSDFLVNKDNIKVKRMPKIVKKKEEKESESLRTKNDWINYGFIIRIIRKVYNKK